VREAAGEALTALPAHAPHPAPLLCRRLTPRFRLERGLARQEYPTPYPHRPREEWLGVLRVSARQPLEIAGHGVETLAGSALTISTEPRQPDPTGPERDEAVTPMDTAAARHNQTILASGK
jgi:hypothetical protein